jgi:hypothetical protein
LSSVLSVPKIQDFIKKIIIINQNSLYFKKIGDRGDRGQNPNNPLFFSFYFLCINYMKRSYDLGQLQSGQNPVVLDPKPRPQTKSQQPQFYFGGATPSYIRGTANMPQISMVERFGFGGC